MNKTIIVPVAADKIEYQTDLPYLFRLDRRGLMPCISAIMGVNLQDFDNIYFTVLKSHCDKFYLRELFDVQFKRIGLVGKASLIELAHSTKNQPETVYSTLMEKRVEGMIFVKDADSYFEVQVTSENSVCVYPLDKMDEVNPQNKSYVSIDDMYYITNIIEKRILGPDFCAGGYVFQSASDFINTYNELASFDNLYMSHIVYSQLLHRKVFRPKIVHNYIDWGTEKEWEKRQL